MKNIETKTVINAPTSMVWKHLMNHKTFGTWNPLITQIKGAPAEGSTIEVVLELPGRKPMTMTPKVLKNSSETEFRWLGHLWTKGIFDGEHYFKLEAISDTETLFTHGENFTGVLSSLILKMIGTNTLQGFEKMNASLKALAEEGQ